MACLQPPCPRHTRPHQRSSCTVQARPQVLACQLGMMALQVVACPQLLGWQAVLAQLYGLIRLRMGLGMAQELAGVQGVLLAFWEVQLAPRVVQLEA